MPPRKRSRTGDTAPAAAASAAASSGTPAASSSAASKTPETVDLVGEEEEGAPPARGEHILQH